MPRARPAVSGKKELLCGVVEVNPNSLQVVLAVSPHDEVAGRTTVGLAIVVVWPYRCRRGVRLRRLLGLRSRKHTHTQQREHRDHDYAKFAIHKALADYQDTSTERRRDNRSPPADCTKQSINEPNVRNNRALRQELSLLNLAYWRV